MINLEEISPEGSRTAAYVYKSDKFGHVNHIALRCKEKGISCKTTKGEVQIFAKTKKKEFIDIIENSFKYEELPECEINKNIVSMYRNKALLCLYIKSENTIYLTESHFKEVVDLIYRKELPKTSKFHIFNKKKLMEEWLTDNKRLMI